MKHRPLVIMFDLENTLIDSWNSGVVLARKVLNIERQVNDIQITIMDSPHDTQFGVFSFAIDHEIEKNKGRLFAEQAMKVNINPAFLPCFKDLENICRFQTDSLQKWEIVNLMGKDLMFPMWCHQFPDKDFVLFDDALPQERITLVRRFDKNNTQTIQMRRV